VGALYFILLGEAAQQMFNAMMRWFTG